MDAKSTVEVSGTARFALAIVVVLCAFARPASAQLEHFMCYEVKPVGFTAMTLSLVDQFQSTSASVRAAHRLCNPADKNQEGVVNTDDHLVGYNLAAPKFRSANHLVENQFHTMRVDLKGLSMLMVPSAKSLVGPPALPTPDIDHFTCYKVRRTPRTPKPAKIFGVSVNDQFGTVSLDLVRPRTLCAPVNKNNEGTIDDACHLLCYKVKAPRGTFSDPFTNNQLGPLHPDLIHRREFCVPSSKDGVPCNPPPTTTSSSTTTTSSSTTSTTLYGSPSRAFLHAVFGLLD